jgi:hypothetical protein
MSNKKVDDQLKSKPRTIMLSDAEVKAIRDMTEKDSLTDAFRELMHDAIRVNYSNYRIEAIMTGMDIIKQHPDWFPEEDPETGHWENKDFMEYMAYLQHVGWNPNKSPREYMHYQEFMESPRPGNNFIRPNPWRSGPLYLHNDSDFHSKFPTIRIMNFSKPEGWTDCTMGFEGTPVPTKSI